MNEGLVFCWSNVHAKALDVDSVLIVGSMEDCPLDISEEAPEIHEKLIKIGFENVALGCYALEENFFATKYLEDTLGIKYDEDFKECVEDIDLEGLDMLLSLEIEE